MHGAAERVEHYRSGFVVGFENLIKCLSFDNWYAKRLEVDLGPAKDHNSETLSLVGVLDDPFDLILHVRVANSKFLLLFVRFPCLFDL